MANPSSRKRDTDPDNIPHHRAPELSDISSKYRGQIWLLCPNKSLDQKGIRLVLVFFATILCFGAIRAIFIGAWPVAIFLLIDLIAMSLALYLALKRSDVKEQLILTKTHLTFERHVNKKVEEKRTLEPYWLQINLIDNRSTNKRCLTLRDKRDTVSIGSWLTLEDLSTLQKSLENHLTLWRGTRA